MGPERRQPRWVLGALLASLALHALLLLAWRQEGAPRRSPPVGPRAPVELDVRWVDAAPTPAPVVKAQAPTTRVEAPRRPALSSTPPATSSASPGPESPATVVAAGGGGQRSDFPVAARPSLLPGAAFAARLSPAAEPEPSHGTTTHNDPAEMVDPVAMREYRGDELKRTLDVNLREDLARAEMGAGRVSPYLRRLENALRDRGGRTEPAHARRSMQEFVRDAARIVLTPGVSDEVARSMADSALGRSNAMQTVNLPNVADQRAREAALQMMSASAAMQERAQQPLLRTVLAITFDATGAIADTSVLERSGDQIFDDSVLQLSRKVVRELPDSDEKGLGTTWWRTRWQFTWVPPGVKVKLMDAFPLDAAQR